MVRLLPSKMSLRTRLLLMQLGIVALVVLLTCATLLPILEGLQQQQYAQRALGVAHAVALMPEIREAFDEPDPSAKIQPIAEALRRDAGLAFVVVSNRSLIRYSHPNPALIGRPLSEGGAPNEDDMLGLDGQAHVVRETGSLGRSIRAKVPIFADDGRMVLGVVSVGILEDSAPGVLLAHWRVILPGLVVSLLLGAAVSYVLAGHVKRQIFGLEPAEIAALLQHREALLHGIREGVLAIDRRGIVTVANAEARRLLDLPEGIEGWPIRDVLPNSELPHVLETGQPQHDQLTLGHNGRPIVVNRMPVHLGGQMIGVVSTFRDQSEVQRLARELDGTRSHLDALRAQAHEFANTLHTIGGLLELGLRDQAVQLISETTRDQQSLVDDLPKRIEEPALAALLLGKASVAAERRITFEVTPHSRLRAGTGLAAELVTIVGNLVDNAFEATEGQPERRVRVSISDGRNGIRIVVADSGPGVPRELRGRIFEHGFSTKAPKSALGQRGVGLALVRQAVMRAGGAVTVRNGGAHGDTHNGDTPSGAVFMVRFPSVAPSMVVAAAEPALPLVG